MGLIPGWGTKILQTVWCGQKKEMKKNMLKRYNGKMVGTHLIFGEFQQRYAYNKKESNGNDKNYSITNIGSIQ